MHLGTVLDDDPATPRLHSSLCSHVADDAGHE